MAVFKRVDYLQYLHAGIVLDGHGPRIMEHAAGVGPG